MELLVRIVETGSMTKAARQMELTPAAVSAAVQRMEGALGLRLFDRTTRTLHPTPEGLVIVEGCKDAVERWERALDEARGTDATLEGAIRLAAPADTSHQIVAQAVAAFCELHRGVRVVLHPTDALQNVLRDALDISIRYGDLHDSTLVARKLASIPRVLVAAPSYLKAHGTPASLDDLASHRLLTLQLGNAPEQAWSFGAGEVPIASPMCGDGLVVRRWAVAGHGIAFKSLIDVIDDLEAGRLVRVLPAADGGVTTIHAVLPSRVFVPGRVRGLVEHLVHWFARWQERCDAPTS